MILHAAERLGLSNVGRAPRVVEICKFPDQYPVAVDDHDAVRVGLAQQHLVIRQLLNAAHAGFRWPEPHLPVRHIESFVAQGLTDQDVAAGRDIERYRPSLEA